VYAIIDRNRDPNPAKADLPADRPYRKNLELVKAIPDNWLDGKPDANATREMLETIRSGSAADTSEKAVALLKRGVAPQSLFDAFFDGAGELLMRAPGILALHATTFTNALHYSWQHCRDEETRKILLLQNAAFLPLFRGNSKDKGIYIDKLEPAKLNDSDAPLEEIFAEISRDRLVASQKVLTYLQEKSDPKPLIDGARRLIFLKGRDSHDYKFSSAVMEDYSYMLPPWRDRYLAASMFYLKGSEEKDNDLVKRTRAALS